MSLFFFNNTQSLVRDVHLWMGVRSSTRAWQSYQGPYYPERMILPPLATLNCQWFLSRGWDHLPHLCYDFGRLDLELVQLIRAAVSSWLWQLSHIQKEAFHNGPPYAQLFRFAVFSSMMSPELCCGQSWHRYPTGTIVAWLLRSNNFLIKPEACSTGGDCMPDTVILRLMAREVT